mmetsp:Transcript_7993/g.11882  ORF Transcript_7993/g.11882 Transcript_7993/m.11882 type:complete len:84 (+) Transcript_7993:42-293(+)
MIQRGIQQMTTRSYSKKIVVKRVPSRFPREIFKLAIAIFAGAYFGFQYTAYLNLREIFDVDDNPASEGESENAKENEDALESF